MHKQQQKAKLLIYRFFLVFLAFFLVANVLFPDKTMSTLENRTLAQFPTKLESDYFKNVESYYSDQFVGRNFFLHLNYLTKKASGVSEIQGVYLGRGQLIEAAADVNEEQLKRNLSAINSFYNSHQDCNFQFLLAPNAVSVQSDKLPAFVESSDQDQQMEQIYQDLDEHIDNVDIRSVLSKHKDEYLYYKTDHHWTSLAAYYAAKALEKDIRRSDYEAMTVSNTFKGTLQSKTGSLLLKDQITIYPPKNTDYIVTYGSTQKTTRSIYQSKALENKDQYQVFFGGNEGVINISCNNDSSKHLLLIKDSYANEIVQFLLPYYRTITIIDPRYYFDDIEQQMNKDLITDVLFLYNTNTFVQDTSIADCLGQ